MSRTKDVANVKVRKSIQVSVETRASIEHVARILDVTVPALMDSIAEIEHADSLVIDILRLVLFNKGNTVESPGIKRNGGIVNIKDYEKQAILDCLRSNDGNITRSAEQLNMSRGSLYRRIAAYGIVMRISCAANDSAK